MLSAGEKTEMTSLQAHQHHAWHAFVVQLAAIALERAQLTEPPTAEATWRAALRTAAAREGVDPDHAFELVVSDLKQPAFMQPPVPEGTLATLKSVHTTPSAELDVLITAKNHDVKMTPIATPTAEHWVYALVVLQTMQGFLGAGNYGIARMNGGFASRPCVAFAPSPRESDRFLRDLRALRAARASLCEGKRYDATGPALLWCLPWDGKTSLAIHTLDPFFVEVCRRVRLADDDGRIIAHRGSSKVARIDASELAGNTGDPWTPVTRDGKALTLQSGFSYERVRECVFGDYQHGAAGSMRPDGDRFWVGQVMVRGQGKTGGYHERWIPVPPRVRDIFAEPTARDALARRAQAWVDRAAKARLSVLKPAILAFLQGGPEELKFDDPRANAALEAYQSAIDDRFFSLLFGTAGATPEEADAEFELLLLHLAKQQLERAFDALPTPVARRHRAMAAAERALYGAARKHLSRTMPSNQPSVDPTPSTDGDTS